MHSKKSDNSSQPRLNHVINGYESRCGNQNYMRASLPLLAWVFDIVVQSVFQKYFLLENASK
jgi:hypothetical protein